MAVTKITYGSLTTVTLTLTSLGSYASREGTLVDNTTTLAMDYVLSGSVKMGAAVSTGDIHVLASSSDGTNISSPATGTDAAITIPQIDKLGSLSPGQAVPGTDLIYVGRVNCTGQAAAAVVKFDLGAVALPVFGGNLPLKWAPVFVNCTGQGLDGTAGGTVSQTAITFTTA